MDSQSVIWHEEAKELKKRLPDLSEYDWDRELETNEEFLISILRDIIKMGGEPPSTGPRRVLSRKDSQEQLDQLMSNDFSSKDFLESLTKLSNGDSVRTIAAKTGLNRNTVHRLQKGEIDPDPWHLDQIARSYGKHPSYFKEWRHMYLSVAVMNKLNNNPDASIQAYLKFDELAKRQGR